MYTRIYWIKQEKLGSKLFGIMSKPRGRDWLEDEIKRIKLKGADYIISLLEREEINNLGLEKEGEYCEKYGMNYINFPIEDVNTPVDENKFLELVEDLSKKLNEGKKLIIHCRMGIGRSSILASGILIKQGVNVRDVFEILSKHRELKVPDTVEQEEWVSKISQRIKLSKD